MARQARVKAVGRSAWYHIYAHAAEYNGLYPLERRGARQELLRLIKRYTEPYFCGVSAYVLMGNHSHMVVRFEAPREVGREELHRRALLLYPGKERMLSRWADEAWERLRCRLFDVSELMRNIQGQFGEWFNKEFDRRGHFWGERFQSSILEGDDAVLDCMLYVELNPVRAKLAQAPEQWEHGSASCRSRGLDGWLMPLLQALPQMDPATVERDYRARLYYRGAVAKEEGRGVIPRKVVEDEERRGFHKSGVYLERFRHFTRGLVLGGSEAVSEWIAALQKEGRLPRCRQPVPQDPGGRSFTLRAQRSRASPG